MNWMDIVWSSVVLGVTVLAARQARRRGDRAVTAGLACIGASVLCAMLRRAGGPALLQWCGWGFGVAALVLAWRHLGRSSRSQGAAARVTGIR